MYLKIALQIGCHFVQVLTARASYGLLVGMVMLFVICFICCLYGSKPCLSAIAPTNVFEIVSRQVATILFVVFPTLTGMTIMLCWK